MDESLRHVTILDVSAGWLAGRQQNDSSQFGEDGLLEAVFERIGETNRWCFEVGAADGEFFSNTKRLRNAGWRAVLIEADDSKYETLAAKHEPQTFAIHDRIKRDSLDRILSLVNAPLDLDLGVIDIDGQDYWAWLGMKKYRPRVMLVEFAYFNAADHIPEENNGETKDQAGLAAIINLGTKKGYMALASTYCNVLFARTDVWESN